MNLSGAEFGTVPGEYDTDLFVSHTRRDQLLYAAGLQSNSPALQLSERLQPTLYGPFAAVELARLQLVVDYATYKGLRIVLNTQNFARRRVVEDGWSTEHLIGSEIVPSAAYADYCARLAGTFKANPSVIFGLMNEPWPDRRALARNNERGDRS